MQFELISTGDEVITGLIVDTNASWLSGELLSLGIQPHFRSTCGDNPDDIKNLLQERSQHADIIFVNGGLGPTTDDNTSASAARAAGVELVRHPEWVEKIRAWHEKRGRPMSETNLKQADIPATAEIIDNPNGTACGFYMKINRALCFFTPGVPHEFKAMYQDFIKPYLLEHCPDLHVTEVKRLITFGIPESILQQRMNDLAVPEKIVIGYRASYPIMELKIISHGADRKTIDTFTQLVKKKIKGVLVCEDNLNFADLIARKIGNAEVNIFDSQTSGRIALELSSALNIKKALAVSTPYAEELNHILDEKECDYYFALIKNTAQDGMTFVFKSRKLNIDRSFNIKLNITIKDKAKAAYTLATQMIILRILNKDDLPKLVIGEVTEIRRIVLI